MIPGEDLPAWRVLRDRLDQLVLEVRRDFLVRMG